jgi:hypothetical protein
MSSAQKMLLNAVNFTGSSDSKWTGQVRHGMNSSQVSGLKYSLCNITLALIFCVVTLRRSLIDSRRFEGIYHLQNMNNRSPYHSYSLLQQCIPTKPPLVALKPPSERDWKLTTKILAAFFKGMLHNACFIFPEMLFVS